MGEAHELGWRSNEILSEGRLAIMDHARISRCSRLT